MADLMKYRLKNVYLWEDNEGCFVRSEPGGHWFAKFPHGNEYRIEPDSDIVVRAIYQDNEVTKDQYDLGRAIFLPYPRLPHLRQ